MKFIKRPIPIEAIQYSSEGPPIPGVCRGQCINQAFDDMAPHIHTLENKNGHTVSKGDWIITGVRGEHYAIKPDIFEETYRPYDAELLDSSEQTIAELRRRIHFVEKHNQIFERCESAWCHPSSDNDPAREAAAIRSGK